MATSFKIGYAFEPNKKTFITDAIVDGSKQRGVDLIKIDTDKPLAEQGPFDCILQRLSNEIRLKQLEEYSSLHSDVLIIDPPSKIEVLHDRYSMLQCVEDMMKMDAQQNEIGMPTFGIPKQVLVTDVDSLMNVNVEGGLKLRFPLIAKPEMVDGSMQSHELSLVYNLDALKEVHTPVVLQEFVNHGGVMFKVYVVGDYATCAKRNSLPDISEEQLDAEKSPVPFSQISNKPSQEHSDHMSNEEIRIEEATSYGLHLMNFDLIRDSRISNHYLILDINYAPGFEKMPSYEYVLTDFFVILGDGKQNSLSEDMKKEEEE
ncbi:hypothetical protein MKX03_003806 [Papaver bracteatum]|nr:hypothetical protein MKX03_003806 [Papaver bracteatum]